jgi:hypothetical protein
MHTMKIAESKTQYKHACEAAQHNTDETKSRQPQNTYKISSIPSIYMLGRVDEALFDKKWVHNFPL